ncbi:MAG: competence protein ComK, partial [Acholeplasmataceae bacterium]|nr:competence protein ComK [Acholeplasmataceae bacterium]
MKRPTGLFYFIKMIEYIINNHLGSMVYQEDQTVQHAKRNLCLIKSMCIEHFFTLEGYCYAVKKKLRFSYRVPLYLDEDHQFLPTQRLRDYENIWINHAAIGQIMSVDHGVEIIFYSGRRIYLKNSLN